MNCVWRGFPGGSAVKNPPAMQEPHETWVQSSGWEDPLEVGMATHFSILAWRIPWTEEPGSYSPWDHKESDTTEPLSTAHYNDMYHLHSFLLY